MQMLGVFAEFERNIAERTKLGVRQAMADGKIVGRPSKLDKEKRKHLLEMINDWSEDSSRDGKSVQY